MSPSVHELLAREVMEQCRDLKHYLIPRAIVVADAPFTVDNGLVTQKLSLKRKPLLSLYGPRILAVLDKK